MVFLLVLELLDMHLVVAGQMHVHYELLVELFKEVKLTC